MGMTHSNLPKEVSYMKFKPIVRPIKVAEVSDLIALEQLSDGFKPSDFVDDDDQNYAYGIFDENGKLFGFCSIGGADIGEEDIESYPTYSDDDLILSDMFIHPDYRHQGYGTELYTTAIQLTNPNEKQNVFADILYDGNTVKHFYEAGGFVLVKTSTFNGLMVKPKVGD